MEPSSAEQLSMEENLSLFEVNKRLLAELKIMNDLAVKNLNVQDEIKTELMKLVYLLNGFTSNGRPHLSYSPDQFLTAYLSLVGPALGNRISQENNDPNEVLKAGIIIARDMLQELNDYNSSTASGQEAIKKALQFSHDPWQDENEPHNEDYGSKPEDHF